MKLNDKKVERPKDDERVKDGRCHGHCQLGCEYKVYGACTYNGDDGCEAQYVPKRKELS